MATFHFHLVAPDKMTFEGEVDQVDIPGAEGDFGVLAGHAPIVALMRPGILTIHAGGQKHTMVVLGGFAEVSEDGLTVLADVADKAEDMDKRYRAARREIHMAKGARAFDSVLCLNGTQVAYGDGLAQRLRDAAPDGIDAFIDLYGPQYVRLALELGVPKDRIDTIIAFDLAEEVGAQLVPMGSAGAKAMAIVLGAADVYAHAGGQYQWDSAAPVAVARAAGLHTSRLDGSPLRYNEADPSLPDLLICRPELADAVLAAAN